MDSTTISSWNTDSGLLQEVLNDSVAQLANDSVVQLTNDSAAQLTKHIARKIIFIPSLPIFLVVVLGLPGNLFVMAVYIRQMTTSTKVYMFSLAVADSAVCSCGIVLTSAKIDHTALNVVLFFIDFSITFSIYMLAFVSVERLVAVWRPHSFSLSALRAKAALAVIAVAAAVSGGILTIARIHRYKDLGRVFPMTVTLVSVLVMGVCYSLVAVKLLKNLKARKNVGVAGGASSLAPGPSTVSHSVVGTGGGAPGASKVPTKQAKTYKGVSLLFLITVIFIACWLPQWLAYTGVYVSPAVRRVFLLNSAVNPFIYSVASAMFRNDVRQFYHRSLGRLVTHCR
ncbi:hypothetical protein NP493_93g03022 [Ridgeia piscesae]|uniref:G-protein coupled receptors family 1 profile domain-containing protein n=1 Tax=Ridgeia piscesae TaxID=27915 RepID=A0AAD9P8H0_RIDPI|nr:hypothetical protein NP493_93g03022 [Ridgeia piscesae]